MNAKRRRSGARLCGRASSTVCRCLASVPETAAGEEKQPFLEQLEHEHGERVRLPGGTAAPS